MTRPRLLIENDDPEILDAQVDLFRSAGFVTFGCGGPHSVPDDACPILEDRPCPLVDVAEVVLCDLDLDDPLNAAVLDHLRERHPEIPVVVEVPNSTRRRHASRLDGCTVVPPFDPQRLVSAVTRASRPTTG